MKKVKIGLRKLRRNIIEYIATNRLFISYVILSIIGLVLLRGLTVNNANNLATFISDLAFVLLFGAFGYIVKPKNRFRYLLIVLIVFTLMEVINSIYYTFYYNFASFGELTAVGQTEAVTETILDKLNVLHIIYIIFPIIFYFVHIKLNNSSYYDFISAVEKGKKMCMQTLLVGCILLAYTLVMASGTDYSRLTKQWNRVYIVNRFGIVLYQCNDLIQTLTPKISALFGYEEAQQLFIKYFTSPERDEYQQKNKYTNILEGKNIIFVHMEGMETFLMDLKFNNKEIVPNLNKLANEGMFFSNFYPQVSSGTSSDTEFTLLTSLMPAASGIVFTSYGDRDYVTLAKLLKAKGYYTFSMHGNYSSMWNRYNVHPNLGYQDMYFEDKFTYNRDKCDDKNDATNLECINLGISDKLFFKEAMPMLEKIEQDNKNYMGTVITLSNHAAFEYLNKYGEFDLSTTYQDCTSGSCESVTTNYLQNSEVGHYMLSAHYADEALGEFLGYIKDSDYFNDTVFVFYGDHDVKLSRSEKNYLYNYDYKTGEVKEEDDPTYQEYDYYDHELNKKTPLIIWTKNKELKKTFKGEVNYVMGMYDVLPTLGNMLNIHNEYALGHDVFNIKNDNYVIFPNGNILTNLIYYNNSSGQYKVLKDGAEIASDYIPNLTQKSEALLEVSNAIVVHDLIKEAGDTLQAIKGNGVND